MPGKDVTTMNRVILMGRLTKNPEIKYAGKDNDMAVARYTLAVNRRYKRDGEQEADFISCITFGKSAEFAQKYLHKGMRIVIGGRISTGSYKDKDGKTIYTKPKDLIGIPWLVALALRGDGWYLRSSIIWHKTNPMPESTRDRPTRCYEYVFLLTKSKKYYYNWQAVAEPIAPTTAGRLKSGVSKGNKYNVTVPGQNQPQKINRPREKGAYADELICPVRSRRNVWQINNVAYHGGHFAAYPPKLAETCILAGCPVGGIVLDPFLGSGTTAAAAKHLSRRYIGIELNPDYCTLAKQRIGGDED